MSTPPPAPKPGLLPRLYRWARRVFLFLVVVLVPAGLIYWVWMEVLAAHGRAQLEQAVAETDAASPGWRWDDLIAARKAIPPEDDSWPVIERIAAGGVGWLSDPVQIDDLLVPFQPAAAPNRQLDGGGLAWIIAHLPRHADRLALARSLKDRPRGQRPLSDLRIDWTGDELAGMIHRPPPALAVSRVLVRAFEEPIAEDRPAAAADLLALLNVAAALKDDPTYLGFAHRAALRGWAAENAERLVGMARPDEGTLGRLQARFRDEQRENGLLAVVRGERALWYRLLEDVRSGRRSYFGYAYREMKQDTWTWLAARGLAFHYGFLLAGEEAQMLRWFNDAEAIAGKPPLEQLPEWGRLGKEIDDARKQTYTFPPFQLRWHATHFQNRLRHSLTHTSARLACAVAGLACERFRLAEGRWPKSLDELVPAYLDAVPTEATGQPVRLAVQADGVKVESSLRVEVAPYQTEPLGFRLWDPDQRRLPPTPPMPDE